MIDRALLKILRTCNSNWFITRIFSPKCPKYLIVVTGCYNSGTTLLQRILQGHPELTGIPPRVEGDVLVRELPKAEDFGWRRMWHRCVDDVKRTGSNPELAKSVLKQWRWWIDPDKGFVEKSVCDMLRFDFYRQSFQALGIPVRFVIIVRHPLPVIEGILRRAAPMPAVAGHFTEKRYPPGMAATQWKASARITVEQMGYEDVCAIRYEDLCDQAEPTLQKLCGFLNLDCSQFRVSNGEIRTENMVMRLHNDNVNSAARFSAEKWMALLETDDELRALMGKFGYSEAVGDGDTGGLGNGNTG